MSYGKRKARGQYSPPRLVKVWIRTAKSLSQGKGIPKRTPYAKNVYGKPVVNPESVKGIRLDPATSMVTAGFYLFGERWPEVYEKVEIPDKRGKMRKLPNNLWKGFEELSQQDV